MNWGKNIAANSIAKIVSGPYDITGALTFKDGDRMRHGDAIKLMEAYWHKVDRILFGRAADKGCGINRLCFVEFGKSQKCIHMHFVAQSPIDAKLFCAILNVLWETLSETNTLAQDNWITPIRDKAAIAGYVTKDVWRFRDDMACTNCDHTGTIYKGFDVAAQVQRISSHIQVDQLEAAYDRVPIHMILIREKMQEREQQLKVKQRLRDQRLTFNLASLRQHLSSI